jgi:hypothetical protein
MSAERGFRLGTVAATLFSTVVAPVFVSLVSNSIKAESTIRAQQAAMSNSTTPKPSLENAQPKVVLLPPVCAPSCRLLAPRISHAAAAERIVQYPRLN